MGFGGKGKDGGGGQWVWQPGCGKGWGKGKGKRNHRSFHAEKKVWIGGIADGVTFRELHEHMKSAGCKWCEVFTGNGAGTGVACFATAEEAAGAIEALNGSELNGSSLVVDVWERKEWPGKGGEA